jgi:hypothetical protein
LLLTLLYIKTENILSFSLKTPQLPRQEIDSTALRSASVESRVVPLLASRGEEHNVSSRLEACMSWRLHHWYGVSRCDFIQTRKLEGGTSTAIARIPADKRKQKGRRNSIDLTCILNIARFVLHALPWPLGPLERKYRFFASANYARRNSPYVYSAVLQVFLVPSRTSDVSCGQWQGPIGVRDVVSAVHVMSEKLRPQCATCLYRDTNSDVRQHAYDLLSRDPSVDVRQFAKQYSRETVPYGRSLSRWPVPLFSVKSATILSITRSRDI